jgi:3-phenylpropionate/cinnamic acid dioxygenase small subunit
VERLGSGLAWAEVPPSRVVRVVGNVLVDEGPAGELDVRSVLLLYRHRDAFEVEQFCGHRHDALRRVGGELRLARRTTWLAANGLPGKNLAVFL